jgi:hypothetical protein
VQPSTSYRLQIHTASHHGTITATTSSTINTAAAAATGTAAATMQPPVSPTAAALNAMSGITADVNDFLTSADNGTGSSSSSSSGASNAIADAVPDRSATAAATGSAARVREATVSPTACAYMPGTTAAFDSVAAAFADIRYVHVFK